MSLSKIFPLLLFVAGVKENVVQCYCQFIVVVTTLFLRSHCSSSINEDDDVNRAGVPR